MPQRTLTRPYLTATAPRDRAPATSRARAVPPPPHRAGATEDSFMEHLAMLEKADDPSGSTTWLEHITDADYRGRTHGNDE